ncbi:MAG: ATP-binding protein, partial [Halolamina sp.]
MDSRRVKKKSPQFIGVFGAVLFLVALVHHATEITSVDGFVGPLIAFLLDGFLALGLVYAGYWLAGTDLSPEERWRVCHWCLSGATLFVAVMGLSLLVRAFEGRVVEEAIFPLLIAAEAGGIAGVVAGYYTARTREEARRARTVSDALGFVNDLIRHDLRNDLTVIQGHAHLLATDAESETAGTESVDPSIIVEKADEALTRIETTGAVAETLIGEPDLEPVDFAAITAEIATRVENTYGIPVTTELPDHATVLGNRGLRSVVDNLLENAVEHNDADEPQVHVSIDTDAERVRLTVTDNGPGIPDEQKERILNPRSRAAEG